MSGILLLIAAAFSLLLTIVYGIVRKQNKLEAELQSVRRIKSLLGFRVARTYPLEEVLRALLATLARAYVSKEATLEFHGKAFGDLSINIVNGEKTPSSLLKKMDGTLTQIDNPGEEFREYTETKDKHITFAIDDDTFSCRVDLHTDTLPIHNEYWYIQELIREKISWSILDKVNQVVEAAFKDIEIPYVTLDGNGRRIQNNNAFPGHFRDFDESELAKAVCDLRGSNKEQTAFTAEKNRRKIVIRKIDSGLFAAFFPSDGDGFTPNAAGEEEGLLLNALDDLSMGVVVLSKDEHRQSSEYKITNINKAFYRIFGLDGSNAQSDEVEEILSAAIRPDEMKKFSVDISHAGSDFFYMRRDGLKVRARVTVAKASGDSRVIIFEPVDNTRLLMSSYHQLINAAQHLFATGDVRLYLKEIRDATYSDGVALAKRTVDSSPKGTPTDPSDSDAASFGKGFELSEKVGFIINVPQLLLEDLPARDLINSQGYFVVPMRTQDTVTEALIALKPNEEMIEIVMVGAKILEAYNLMRKENHDLHLLNAKSLTEAKRADMANRSKSEFLASMSHEIRTPLNSIIGFAEIIHAERADLSRELLGEFSGNIVAAGKHLLSLINDILDLTKVETGKMKLELQEFSINEAVESIQRILRPLLDKGRIQFEALIEDGLDVFVADTVKFKQILYNLLNNAIAYSPEGSTVKLEIARSAEGIEMKAIDKGTGIKKEDIDKLFKPFVQLGAKHGGTGLGLVLTKKLVELHGGAIWIDSAYGAGTTVVVYLPNCPAALVEKPDEGVVAGKEEEIFFVTDDNHLFDLFATVVDGMGFKLKKIGPLLVEEGIISKDEGAVLVIDASPENLNGNVISACGDAWKTLLLTEPQDVRAVSDLLKDYEDKVSFIDRRNFTKSELLTELNTAGRI